MSHMFGQKERLAVQYELLTRQSIRDLSPVKPISDEEHAYWLFGHLCLWVTGSTLGDYRAPTALTVALASVSGQLLRHRGRRYDPHLMLLSATTAFRTIDDAIYSARVEPETPTLVASHDYRRFVALPDLDVFDGWKAYLIEGAKNARYLWCGPEGVVREAQLLAGEFDAVLEDFLADLERTTGQQRTV